MNSSLVDLKYDRIAIPQENVEGLQQLTTEATVLYRQGSLDFMKSNVGGYHSPVYFYQNSDHPFHLLAEPLIEYVNQMIQSMRPREETFRFELSYWYIVNAKGDYNMPHNHMPSQEAIDNNPFAWTLLSGVYYLKTPQNSGNIVFHSDRKYYRKWFKDDFDETVRVSEGDCLVFPPHLMHSVEPNMSEDLRICMAFNVNVGNDNSNL